MGREWGGEGLEYFREDPWASWRIKGVGPEAISHARFCTGSLWTYASSIDGMSLRSPTGSQNA